MCQLQPVLSFDELTRSGEKVEIFMEMLKKVSGKVKKIDFRRQEKPKYWKVLESQIPNFKILLKPTQLVGIYTQKAATQLTTKNTSAVHNSIN